MQRKLLWILAAVIVCASIVYYALGGFNEIALEVTEISDYKLVGKHYEGVYERDTIAALFYDAKDLSESLGLPGKLTVVDIKNASAVDSISIFIGVQLQSHNEKTPEGATIRDISGGRVVRAIIESHSIVMPTREKTEERMNKFAHENNLEFKGITIERYVSEDKLIIEKFIKP